MRFEEMLEPGCIFLHAEDEHGASLRCFFQHDRLCRQLFDVLQERFLFQLRQVAREIDAGVRGSQLLQRDVQVDPRLQGLHLAGHGRRLVAEGHDLAGEYLYLVCQV